MADDAAACVYVRAAVLTQLERDKRELRRQLAAARQQAEARAAAAGASEARAADLLAILELNRNGADRALQQLRAAKDAQRRALAGCVLRLLLRRLAARRLRLGLARWRSQSDRLRLVHGGEARAGGRDAGGETHAVDTQPAECAFAFDECFRLRFARRRELRAVAFAAWKALARQRRLQVASCRRRRERRLLVTSVCCWRLLLERRARARLAVRRLVARHTRRWLLTAWTTLRHACVHEGAAVWIQALDAARRAVDEEREQLTRERYEALRQAHDAVARDQLRAQRHAELYSHRLASLARDDLKQRYFSRWKRRVSRVVWTRMAALRLARSRHWKLRRVLNAWRHEAKQTRALRHTSEVVASRTSRQRLALAFQALSTHASVVKRRRVALRRLNHKFRTARALSHAWTRWRIHAALESQRLLVSYHDQQLADHFEIRAAMHQHELRREGKLRRQAQLVCSLHLRDRRRELLVRSVMTKWALVARVQARRRRHLQRLMGRNCDAAKRRAISQWHQHASALTRRVAGVSALALRRQTHRMRGVFSVWQLSVHRDRRVRFDRDAALLRLEVSRLERDRALQRGAVLYRLMHRRWLADARRQALFSWRRRVDDRARRETLAAEERKELVASAWTVWTRYCCHRLRTRARQYRTVYEKLEHREQTLVRKRAVFAAWYVAVSRRRVQRRCIERRVAAQRATRVRLSNSFDRWRCWRHVRHQRRRSLVARLCRRRHERIVRFFWHQWARHTAVVAVQEAQKRAHCTANGDRRALVSRFVASRRRHWQLKLAWSEWTAWIKHRRRAKHDRLTAFVERQQVLKLRRECFQRWRRAFMVLSSRTRSALRALLRQSSRRQLLRAFRDWQRQARSLAVVRLLASHSRAECVAADRFASLASTKRASRTTQRAFSAWKRFADQQRTRRRACRCLGRRYAIVRMRTAWQHWFILTRVSRHLHRLATLVVLHTRRVAWGRLVSSHAHFVKVQRRARLLKFVASTWRRWQMRIGWNDWRTQTVNARLANSQKQQLEAALALQASVDQRWLRWACRWHRRSTHRRVFRVWQAYVARQKHWHAVLHAARAKQLSRAIVAWRQWTRRERNTAQTLLRLARSAGRRELRCGMTRWRSQCESRRVTGAQRALLLRALSSPSPSSIRSLNSYRPWLAACFAAWRSFYLRRRRQLHVLSVRRSVRLIRSTLHAWRRLVSTGKQLAQLVRKQQRRITSSLFHQWKRETHTRRQELESILSRLVLLVQRSLWRQGWQGLRTHHGRETMRRQSALAFQSAQSVIDQHRRALAMRSAGLMLARRQRLDAGALFQRWRSFVVTRRQTRQVDKAGSTRMTRFRLRAAIAKWHLASHLSAAFQRSVQRWLTKRQRQELQRRWCTWIAFIDDLRARRRAMTRTITTMLVRSVAHRLKRAWSMWTALAMEARDRDRQRRLDATNERVLLLVSDRSRLQEQHARELRHRSLSFFVVTLATVLARSSQSNTEASQARAFDHWRHSILIVHHRVMSRLVAVVSSRARRFALLRWREFAHAQRTSEEVKQHRQRTFERAAVLFASATTQTRKRRVMLTWQAFTLARRTKRRQRSLMVATISRGLDRATTRRCFRSWTRFAHSSIRRKQHLNKVSAIIRGQRLRWAFHEWQRQIEEQERVQTGIHILLRVCRRSDLKMLGQRWQRWRRWLMQANAEIDQRDDRRTMLRRVFRVWMLHLVGTSERLRLHERRREMRAVVVCFSSWRRECQRIRDLNAGSKRTPLHLFVVAPSRQRAVVAVTAPGRYGPCLWSYRRYRINAIDMDRRRRRAWAALRTIERTALVDQVRRQYQHVAVARLARSLRRHHRRVLKLALWTWLARVQTVAPSLWATNLSPSTPTDNRKGDVVARIASIVLRDLGDARAQFSRKCWRVVALAACNHRRWWLRHGFERLRIAVAVHRRRQPPQVSRLQSAAARAMVDRLATTLTRAFFREWKARYVAAALREAEAAHEALLLALHDTALGRQALDPLRAASPTSIGY